jgi:hypothetical protein
VQVKYGGTDGSSSTVNLYIDPTGTSAPATPNLTLTGQNLSTNPIGSVQIFAGGEGGTFTTKTATDFGEAYIGNSFPAVVASQPVTHLAYEGFTGGSGSLASQTATEGSGWGGGWSDLGGNGGTIIPSTWGTLPNSNQTVSGFAVQEVGTGTGTAGSGENGVANRDLSTASTGAINSAMSSGGSIFYSFLIQRQDTNVRNTYVYLMNSAETTPVIYIGYAAGNTNWGVDINSGPFQQATTGSNLSGMTTATTLLVVQVIYGGTNGSSSTVNLFVDPTGTTVPTTPNLQLTGQNLSITPIGSVAMIAGGEITGPGYSYTTKTTTDFGELNVGTTFGSVI